MDSDTLGKFNHEPKEYEVPIVDTLTAEEKSQFDSTKADIQRLQLLNGGLSTLLRERLPIDPNYSGGRTELAHRARLSMLRLIGNISWLQNVVAISHPNNDEVRRLVHEISTALTADDIVQLQRVFLGGSKGKNARAEILSHEVGIATRRRGLARPETTRGVCVLGPKGTQLISLVDDIESEV